MTDTLPEVAVSDADTETRDIYERIMTATGVGSPALIYRHFAVYPGMLAWVWSIVGASLESGQITAHALKAVGDTPIVPLPAVSAAEMQATGVDADGHRLIEAMIATYNRMNPVNLSLITAIRNLLDPTQPPAPAASLPPVAVQPPPVAHKLPAPLSLNAMRGDVRDAVLDLSAAIPSALPSSGTQVIPTLYRHLAIWPDFLMHVAPGLLQAMHRGEVEARMADLNAAMQPLIDSVTAAARDANPPAPPLDDPQAMVTTLNSFLYTIPQLVVVGTALRAAIPTAKTT
ncbi:hypothetical protein L2D14_13635 [Thalassospiraceae bacterium LMO-JJ14]|nr:hypothetical protein L2D14_13635 [Thalassospiraceae bacterium LMO-JJ14]